MEKRRRERINTCLDQLKTILMEVTKKEVSYLDDSTAASPAVSSVIKFDNRLHSFITHRHLYKAVLRNGFVRLCVCLSVCLSTFGHISL